MVTKVHFSKFCCFYWHFGYRHTGRGRAAAVVILESDDRNYRHRPIPELGERSRVSCGELYQLLALNLKICSELYQLLALNLKI